MPSPIIGITAARFTSDSGLPLVAVTEPYVQAVFGAGGLPLIIPAEVSPSQAARLLPHLQGILLTGGGDIDPALFGGAAHPRVYGIEADRDALELFLVRQAVEQQMPFFGICRGHQVLNVALGGGLYTDLGDQHPGAARHDYYPNIPRGYIAHSVRVEPGSRLEGILGARGIGVNSLHHQGLTPEHLAPGLLASAFSPDGLVEGLELPGHPFGISVQWHPEWLQSDTAMQSLFRSFVKAAEARSLSGD